MVFTGIMKKEMELASPERSEGERSEPSRSGGETNSMTPADPEVESKAKRRKFSAAYKQRILDEADKSGPGSIAGLLRREGLYSSHLNTWRKQRESGEIAGLEPRKRGKKPAVRNPLAGEVDRLTRDNQRLQKRLKQAEIIIDVQKKLCDILGLTVPPIERNESDE
jgi:transposase-like protein